MSYMVGVKKKSSQKATENASVVSLVRKAGAIVLLVSNTPELCLNWETNNKVTGTTKNPYDTRKTPGGSSGGEVCIYLNCIRLIAESLQETCMIFLYGKLQGRLDIRSNRLHIRLYIKCRIRLLFPSKIKSTLPLFYLYL